ncbi:NAD(P)H-dependent glycerol-3-phosphate dehydrogenase [Megamonas hypermegale]|uniref:NAD(P)H-dependent glycerol-3-phosphate dehydrogenase n=1 Tax=Megamonas hypermegale TaxID=158847 RepID=UPI0026ECBD96|nr:NAD(P)H-dependent glycerol-3-phosphate dehydrogenase [Megamonas hypermegale]
MNISILGCGRWASFHAWYAHHIGHNVTVWGRKNSANLQTLMATHKNEYLTLPEDIHFTDDLATALHFADTVIISISSQQLRDLAQQINKTGIYQNKTFVLCMKGIEISTGKRLSEVLAEELTGSFDIGVWVGPGHVQDFLQGIPNCMVVSALNNSVSKKIIDIFSSDLIRFYYSRDLIGTEIGAAAKNVVGIAAGMLDGMHYTSLKGALMARGTYELSNLIKALGGNGMTVYGLSHLGDYEATLFSPYSNNRRFGEDFVQHKPFHKLAEGVFTMQALLRLAEKYRVELPICATINEIVINHKEPKQELLNLFMRPLKAE